MVKGGGGEAARKREQIDDGIRDAQGRSNGGIKKIKINARPPMHPSAPAIKTRPMYQ